MNEKVKNKILTLLFVICICLGGIVTMILPDSGYSRSERRALEECPKFSWEALADGSFMNDFDAYVTDQFPARDTFRGIKALAARYLMGQKDVNDLYKEDGYLVKMEYPLNQESLSYASEKFSFLYDNYLKESGSSVYFAVIPDKNIYLGEEYGRLHLDYKEICDYLQKQNTYATFIPLDSVMTKDSFYTTDTHWRQEMLPDVAKEIHTTMGNPYDGNYTLVDTKIPFQGVYMGQYALPVKSDSLSYLTNATIEGLKVYDHESGKEVPVYDLEAAKGEDGYEMFAGGYVSLITLENPNADTDKELIVFRDSFGGAISPLLAEGYRKVTLVDIRYLASATLPYHLEFKGQDVLFLYSTLVLNESSTLK